MKKMEQANKTKKHTKSIDSMSGKVDGTVVELFEWNEMKNVSCSSIRMAFNAYEMCIKGNL